VGIRHFDYPRWRLDDGYADGTILVTVHDLMPTVLTARQQNHQSLAVPNPGQNRRITEMLPRS
jgi:hypothetical protein